MFNWSENSVITTSRENGTFEINNATLYIPGVTSTMIGKQRLKEQLNLFEITGFEESNSWKKYFFKKVNQAS